MYKKILAKKVMNVFRGTFGYLKIDAALMLIYQAVKF